MPVSERQDRKKKTTGIFIPPSSSLSPISRFSKCTRVHDPHTSNFPHQPPKRISNVKSQTPHPLHNPHPRLRRLPIPKPNIPSTPLPLPRQKRHRHPFNPITHRIPATSTIGCTTLHINSSGDSNRVLAEMSKGWQWEMRGFGFTLWE